VDLLCSPFWEKRCSGVIPFWCSQVTDDLTDDRSSTGLNVPCLTAVDEWLTGVTHGFCSTVIDDLTDNRGSGEADD